MFRTFARLSSTSTLQNSFNWPTSLPIPNKETRTIYDALNNTSWHRLKSAGAKMKNVPRNSYRLHQQCCETVTMPFCVSKERRLTICPTMCLSSSKEKRLLSTGILTQHGCHIHWRLLFPLQNSFRNEISFVITAGHLVK